MGELGQMGQWDNETDGKLGQMGELGQIELSWGRCGWKSMYVKLSKTFKG